MTQRSVDAHIQMPKDFAYVPFEMVEACGSASFRMPYPYKIRLPSHSPLDQLYADFKALDKATVLTREIGEGPDDSDDYLRNSKFTKHSGSQEEPVPATTASSRRRSCSRSSARRTTPSPARRRRRRHGSTRSSTR